MNEKRKKKGRISLEHLTLEEALRAALETPPPKREKKSKEPKKRD